MSLKDKKEIINELLRSLFRPEDNISFYFLKKTKTSFDDELIIPFKTRKLIDLDKIREVEKKLKIKTGENDLKLFRWSEVIGSIVPLSGVFKIPFFDSRNIETKAHPWRVCPIGEHWVKRHPKHLQSGKTTDHDGHCRKKRKNKSEFYHADELNLIAETYFKGIETDFDVMPIPDDLGYKNGNKYDTLIAGWTKFWNEVLKPDEPLSPDLVKALIATESSFNLPEDRDSNDGLARGLIQVTESTRKILQNYEGELKNNYIELSVEQSRDPITNIAVGIRWLHHKKFILERRMKRKVTWEESIAEYKGITKQLRKKSKNKADEIMGKIKKLFKKLNSKREAEK